ncbi:MAG TPA: helix-turn-helix domain-containing protein [Chloroflexota bacterium]|nr:helix-turn-helix domain-containing protein [Chloroflexota bacterium]
MSESATPAGAATPREPAVPAPGAATVADDRASRVAALAARLQDERLEVLPFYHDLRNQIVRPLNLHVETRYFFRTWKPRLGPVLTLLIMELRDRCYYNPRTGERRDYCWPSQEELARSMGVSVRTVIRALQEPLARRFIRVQYRYRYDPLLGKKVRTSSAYLVAMDDPLVPEDDAELKRRAAERLLVDETTQRDLLRVDDPTDLRANLAARTLPSTDPALTDNVAGRPGPTQTDKLSPLHMTDTLSEEEVPTGRGTQQKQKPESVPLPLQHAARVEDARTALDRAVLQVYADANNRPPTPLECRRLAELVQRFDPVARQADPPSTGAAWVVAAIVEAVDTGSAFVAPRRITTICEGWERAPAATRASRQRSARHDRRAPRAAPSPIASPADAPVSPAEPTERDDPAPIGPVDEGPEPTPPTFVVSARRPITNWQLWRLVTDELIRQPIGERHRSWLEQAAFIGQEDGALVVGAPSRFARDLLEDRLAEPLTRAIATVLGETYPIHVVVGRVWLAANRS